MVKKIYGTKHCYRCKRATEKWPDAKYKLIEDLNNDERKLLLVEIDKIGQKISPILLDYDDNIISHDTAGLKWLMI